jgi:type IV pilus biogenesis protein CpaD/CtpE
MNGQIAGRVMALVPGRAEHCTSIQSITYAMSALPEDIEEIHPSLWRANPQVGRTVATGDDRLTANCPAAVS